MASGKRRIALQKSWLASGKRRIAYQKSWMASGKIGEELDGIREK